MEKTPGEGIVSLGVISEVLEETFEDSIAAPDASI